VQNFEWLPAPPLGTRFLQLLLERVGTSRVSAQTSGGLAEAHQLPAVWLHLRLVGKPVLPFRLGPWRNSDPLYFLRHLGFSVRSRFHDSSLP